MTTATEILNIAESQIGYTEQPPNSNITKYGEWYGMNGEPWCDMFVSWIFAQADASSLIGGEFAYCPYHEQWFRDNGLWSNDNPQVGDVVFFGHPIASHIGIVKEPFDGGVKSIEGNTSLSSDDNGGAVMERTRYYDYIRGFGKVRYNENTSSIEEETGMNVIVEHVNGENVWAYFDGHDLHDLTDPDDIVALDNWYMQAYGKPMPRVDGGAEGAPWTSRIMQIVNAGAPSEALVPSLDDFKPRSPK